MINRASNSDQPFLNATPRSSDSGNLSNSGSHRRSKSDALAVELLEPDVGHDTAVEVLNSFIRFAHTSIDDLRNMANTRNAEQARALAKEFGSSCRAVGASSLLRSCLLLEDELQDPEWPRVRQYIDALAVQTKAVSQKMRQLLS